MSGGTLYLVATPIGNLGDLSGRAAEVLAAADVVFAEDTRHSGTLARRFGLALDLESLHEHNERKRVGTVLARLERGESVAVVSDAGTPGVSDPGAVVVRAAVEAGHRVCPIPGPSALAAALSVSGFVQASTNVLFVGFLPVKGTERSTALARVAAHAGVVVLYEGPHRIGRTLADLVAAGGGDRSACVCRELTKLHEEILHGSVFELAEWAAGEVKGELTVVLGPTSANVPIADDAAIDAALERCLAAGLSARDAASAVAAIMQLPKRRVYHRCVELAGR
jgi:16S rRNA (cytidine1402-2'-O)-methyltransferase